MSSKPSSKNPPSEPPKPIVGDAVVRALTDDDSFRVMTARTTEMVSEVTEVQGVQGEAARQFGDLLTAAVLFRETMSPAFRAQAVLDGSKNSGRLIADAHPEGHTRGLARLAQENRPLELGRGAILRMMRTIKSGKIHEGVIEVPQEHGAGSAVAHAMMAYMHTSEQIPTMIGVATIVDKATHKVVAAGGYLVQVLPGVAKGPLMLMTERLAADFQDIDQLVANPEFDPDWLRSELLFGIDHARLEAAPVSRWCNCSEERVFRALATLPQADIQSMVDDGKAVELSCDYCRKDYPIALAKLQGLLAKS